MLHKNFCLLAWQSSPLHNRPELPLKTFYSKDFSLKFYENTFYLVLAPVKTVVNTSYSFVFITYSNDFNNTATIPTGETEKGGGKC